MSVVFDSGCGRRFLGVLLLLVTWTIVGDAFELTQSCSSQTSTLTPGDDLATAAADIFSLAGINLGDNADMTALINQVGQTGGELTSHKCEISVNQGKKIEGFALCRNRVEDCSLFALFNGRTCTSASLSCLDTSDFYFSVDCKNLENDYPDCALDCGPPLTGTETCFPTSSDPTPSPTPDGGGGGDTSAATRMVAPGFATLAQAVLTVSGMASTLFLSIYG